MSKLEYSKEDIIEMQNDIDKLQQENKQMKHNITMAIDMLEEFKDKYGVYGSYIDEILEELRENNEK